MDKAIGNAGIRNWLFGLIVSLFLIPVSAYAQTQRTVTGTVIDETKEPLIGATVKVVGTSIGVTTDFDGHYVLKVPTTAKQLVFSYVGYDNLVVDITSNVIDVTLKPNSEILNEVVVIGYGVAKKEDLTGSVSSVSRDDITSRGTTGVLGIT